MLANDPRRVEGVSSVEAVRRLVVQAQDGNRAAVEELYLMHFERIYSYLHLSVGNRHDAEDLTTQTFLRMLEAIGRFHWREVPFSAWLFRIAHNLAMDHFRASKRVQSERDVPEPPGAEESSAEEQALDSLGRAGMLELIQRLSPEQRQVLTLKFLFGFANGEVATILGKTEGAVKSLQHRALASLQKQSFVDTVSAQSGRTRVRRSSLGSRRGGGGRYLHQEMSTLDIGLVGLPGSGKSTLFKALTGVDPEAGGYGKLHVGMASIPDERLGQVARVLGSDEATPAAVRVTDTPGLSSAVLGELRKADALLAVTRSFGPDLDRERDEESLRLELVVADRDHVERRLERVRTQAKSGDPELRKEVEALRRVLAHLEEGRSLAEYQDALPEELEPLTTKPLVWVVNGGDGIDLSLEAELAELEEDEAAAFREGPSALESTIARLFEEAGLITFFTGNEKETRAWTLVRGGTALDAAGAIHSDMARGFIRCEVIAFADLVEAGSRAEAARRGVQRLEGKTYVVADGDVLNIRFNV